ncbi:MAG: hypothetical protein C4294_09470 [Nitrospiraceae bacterium]
MGTGIFFLLLPPAARSSNAYPGGYRKTELFILPGLRSTLSSPLLRQPLLLLFKRDKILPPF